MRLLSLPLGLAVWPAVLGCATPISSVHGGSAACGSCHSAEVEAWRGSDHAAAQGPVDQALGRFDGTTVVLPTLQATPALAGEARVVRVVDGAGERTWQVVGVVGHQPLQQLILQGDGERIVAPIAWDVDAERWFDPTPGGAQGDPTHPLYWAGLAGTWEHQCADCHSTGFAKAFDGQAYRSTADSHDVSCAACHGETPTAPSSQVAQDAVCSGCHSRKTPIAPGSQPQQHHVTSVLDSGIWGADGSQIEGEEGFAAGAFQRSRMHAAGVTCTDCHDPHSGAPRLPGDAPCERCHAHDDHSGHTGVACVDCHMPETLFMGVDGRRDHDIRVPDPELARELGTTSACENCHRDVRPLPTSPGRIARRDADRAFARQLHAGLQGEPSAVPGLVAAATDPALPPSDRASALRLLATLPPSPDFPTPTLADPAPLVRAAAADAAGHLPPEALEPLLIDPVRSVRFAALRSLVGRSDAPTLPAVLADWEASSADVADDLPSRHVNAAVLRARTGDLSGARAAADEALRLDPTFAPARAAKRALASPAFGPNHPE